MTSSDYSAYLASSPEERNNQYTNTIQFVILTDLIYPEIPYYGANLGYFPENARNWIINKAFPKENMERPYFSNPTLKVWWDDDNNRIWAEAAGGKGSYYGSPDIFTTYGEYAYYRTLKFKYDYSVYSKNMIEKDPAFAEIINFAKQLCAEIEYDWASFSGYRGARVKPTPGQRRAVCDGYATEVMEKALKLSSVQAVQRWSGPNHAWNVLKLIDGRTLYFDLTWFDNEHINHETGEIYQTDDYDWENITFFKHLFRFSNIGYGSRQFTHNLGSFSTEIRK